MPIPTEPVGSIPRPPALLEGIRDFSAGRISQERLRSLYDWAIRDTIERFEATGSPVITNGEQTKPMRTARSGSASRVISTARRPTSPGWGGWRPLSTRR